MKKNWRERIDEARERGEFTMGDLLVAANWPSCACGEQDILIPRKSTGKPKDRPLARLGGKFLDAIIADNFDKAEKILTKIESRAAVLILKQIEEIEKRP